MRQNVKPMDLSVTMRPDRPLLDYFWLAMPDQAALLTLLWGKAGEDRREITGAGVAERIEGWRTDIWAFMAGHMPSPWLPGQMHPNGSMFAADDAGTLYGWHIGRPRVIYGCDISGGHLGKLDLPLMLETPLSPRMQTGTVNVQIDGGEAAAPQWCNLAQAEARSQGPVPWPPVQNPWRFWPGPDEDRLQGFIRRHCCRGLAQRFDSSHWHELRAAAAMGQR